MAFKLDIGAEVSVITEAVMELISPVKMRKASKILCGPDKKWLQVMGEPPMTSLSYCTQTLYVIKGVTQCLLRLPAIQALQLLSQVNKVETSIPDQYLALFTGLGTFPSSYEI